MEVGNGKGLENINLTFAKQDMGVSHRLVRFTAPGLVRDI